MNWQHIYPLGDIFEHDFSGLDCDCNPSIDWNGELVIHKAFDGRDLIAEIEQKLIIELPDGSSISET